MAVRLLRVALTTTGFAAAEVDVDLAPAPLLCFRTLAAEEDPLAFAFEFEFEFVFALVATGLSARPFRVRAALVTPVVVDAAAAAVLVVLCRFALGGRADGSLSIMALTSLAPLFRVIPSPSPATRFRDLVDTMVALPLYCVLSWPIK